MSARRRLAIVASHPIQYYVPLYRAIAAEGSVELKVFFASQIGMKPLLDPDMGVEIAWAMDLTGGFEHAFLPGAESKAKTGFREINNPVGRALGGFKPDVVIVHGYAMLTMLRAIAWCRLRGVPVIIASDSSTHSSGPGWRRLLKKTLLPSILRQFSAFLTMSERSENHWRSVGIASNRLFRVPMMLPEIFIAAQADSEMRIRARRSSGFGDNERVLICVGKLYPGKRITDIIHALAHISFENAAVTLLIAGDGEQRADLEALAGRCGVRAVFAGFVNLDGLPSLYAASDVFVHAAELEQYGMAVLEAATMGLPMVLSDRIGAIGATSIARPDENALVYPCGDRDALGKAIARMVGDGELRRRMGARSLELAASHTGPESVRGVLAAVELSMRRPDRV